MISYHKISLMRPRGTSMGYCMKLFLVKSLILRLNNYLPFFLPPDLFPLVPLSHGSSSPSQSVLWGSQKRTQPANMPLGIAKKAVFLESTLRCCLFHWMGEGGSVSKALALQVCESEFRSPKCTWKARPINGIHWLPQQRKMRGGGRNRRTGGSLTSWSPCYKRL